MVTLEQRGFLRMLRLRGRDLKNLRTGLMLRGTISRPGAWDLPPDPGVDPRGHRILEVQTPAPSLNKNDRLMDQASKEQFSVTAIGLDAPSYSAKYQLEQLTAKDS